MATHYTVTVTAPTSEEAKALGQYAVESRMAACAQVSGPITSTYWWDGEITSASEYVCTLKTTSHRLQALMEVMRGVHSYDVPEIVAVPLAAGDSSYLAWIEAETRER